jgi:hypothetical protein
MSKHHHEPQVWAIEGRFTHLVYSPKGAIEGLMLDTDGTPTQFVIDPHDLGSANALAGMQPGEPVVVEGTEMAPSDKDDGAHFVYRFERLASVSGRAPAAGDGLALATGRVVRFNYARHGAVNGVVLDSGDFVHTRPDGMALLGLQIGDAVQAEGVARPLFNGAGQVIEARTVNGQPLGEAH